MGQHYSQRMSEAKGLDSAQLFRLTVLLAKFAFCGIGTTVVIAWICAITVYVDESLTTTNVGFGSSQRLLELDEYPDWLSKKVSREERALSISEQRERFAYEKVVDSRGWPFRALKYELWLAEFSWRDQRIFALPAGPAIDHVRGCISFYDDPERLLSEDNPGLPYIPMWSGFLANSAIFGLVWYIIWHVMTKFVRFRRVKRGRCPTCGYLLKSASARGCPECGWNRPVNK